MGKTITPIGQSTGRTVSTVSPSGKTVTPIGGHAKTKKGGGFLGHIPGYNAVSKVASQAGKDVYHVAVNSPAGLYYAGKALTTDVGKGIANVPQNLAAGVGLAKPPKRSHQTADIVQAQVHQTVQDFKHPLRHPGLTGLDVLGIASLGAGGVARVGEAGRVARAGEGAGAVAKAAARGPKPGVRTFKVGDLEVTKPASKAASTRAVQSTLDKRRNRAAAKNPGGRAARAVATKAGKAQEETLRIEQALATAPAGGLQALGKRLKPHEQMALRVVAEEAPLEKRIAASRARQAAARSPLEARRHGRRVKLLEQARAHIVPEGKLPPVPDGHVRLYRGISEKPSSGGAQHARGRWFTSDANYARIYARGTGNDYAPGTGALHYVDVPKDVAKATRREDVPREHILPAAISSRVKPLAAASAKPELNSPRLQGVYDRMQSVAGGREALGKQLGLLTDEMIQGRKTSALRASQGLPISEPKLPEPPTPGQLSLVEPEKSTLPVASPSATYVPDAEQRVGRNGRIASVGAQGTIGKTRSPIKYGYTGGAKAAAREPLDTTRAVAEGNLAVTKYARLVNLQKNLRKAASPTPRFKDDIAVRLDKIGAHDSLPADAKAFVNDPAQLERLTPDEQTSKLEQLRKSFILGNDKEISGLAPAQLAEFERLHAQGKVGWVPRRLLGDLAKPAAPVSATVGKTTVSIVDAINNATKLSVLYLKPAYAVPNLLGNLALNLVQQGFAAPVNLAKASRLAHTLGPELTAHVDTIMGEGFASALRGESGKLSKATQAMAGIWGKGVDKPFRRASFLHEAAREGFRSPAQVTKLLQSPELHDTLVDVAKRANREIIDYGRLSSKEREIVRRVVFFYPWLKGSTMYAGNLLIEHPIKAAALGRLGVLGRERSQQELGPTPSFLEGAFKGPGGGLVNPTAAAILQTPAQVGAALAGLAGGNAPATGDLSQFLTPALSIAANKIAGQNLFTGQTYAKGHQGIIDVAKDTLVGSAPQTQLIQGLRGTSKSKLYPGSPRTAIGRYLLGGLYPRPYNPGRMHALARAEQRGK